MTLRQRTPFSTGSGLSAVAPASATGAARKSARLMRASALRFIGGSLERRLEGGGPAGSRSRSVTRVVQLPRPVVPGMGDVVECPLAYDGARRHLLPHARRVACVARRPCRVRDRRL